MKAKIYIFITALFIGVVLGYAWRMAQVEPQLDSKAEYVYKQNQMLTRDLMRIETKVAIIEDRIQGIERRIRKQR